MNRRSSIGSLLALAAGATLLRPQVACAGDEYPSKPIRVIVPWPAGGVADVGTRKLCAVMEPILGQSLIVENKAGASGMIGAEWVAKSKPDGYTILRGDMVTHAVNSHMFSKVPYDPQKDFVPICGHGRGVMLLLVHPEVKARTFSELLELAKAKPGTLHYGAPNGTPQHLVTELLKQLTGIDIVHIPYKGEGPALTDLTGGHIQMMFSFVNASGHFVKAGSLRALAVTRSQRVPMLPEVPSVIEIGLPALEMSAWGGFFAPAGTPRPIVDKLNAAIRKALEHPDIQSFFASAGSEPMANSPEQFSALLASEARRWGEVVRRSGAKAD